MIAPTLVDNVELVPSAYPARFGRFAGGIMSGPDIDQLKAHGVAEVFTPGSPLPVITEWLEHTLDARESDRRASGAAP